MPSTHEYDVRLWFEELAEGQHATRREYWKKKDEEEKIKSNKEGKKRRKRARKEMQKASDVVVNRGRSASKFQIYLLSLRSHKRQLARIFFLPSLKFKNFINWRRSRNVSQPIASISLYKNIYILFTSRHILFNSF